jgi:hypothetical protein
VDRKQLTLCEQVRVPEHSRAGPSTSQAARRQPRPFHHNQRPNKQAKFEADKVIPLPLPWHHVLLLGFLQPFPTAYLLRFRLLLCLWTYHHLPVSLTRVPTVQA